MTTPDRPADVAAALGLGADAGPEEVARVRERLLSFLDGAPAELGPWAARQRELVAPAQPPAGVDAAELELLGLDPETTPGATPATAVAAPHPPRKRPGWLVPLALAVLSALVVIGVYRLGGDPQTANPAASSSAQAPVQASTPQPVDLKLVEALQAKVRANPKDTLSMKALGQVYDRAGDYANAATWQQRVTQVNPKDVDAWLALGVAQFNGANLEDAEVSWKKAATLAPRRAEIYYNLGFLYMSQNQMEKARDAWQTVVALDPRSDLAQMVAPHLKRATASPTTSAPVTPSATPTR